MNARAQTFLAARALDGLLEARKQLAALDVDAQAVLMSILRAWTNTQAVANLLIYPELLPAAERAEYVLKGLRETRSPYLALQVLAALRNTAIGLLRGQVVSNPARSRRRYAAQPERALTLFGLPS